MELGKLNMFHQLSKVSGWISIISGLIVLFLFNIGILTSYMINFMNDTNLLIFISIGSGIIALFNKQHRTLGIWGLFIALFSIIFIFGSFILGWIVVPFP